MTVYVDKIRKRGNWAYGDSCHLAADSEAELLAFADRMGLKRHWYQITAVPHFDLNKRMRELAIKQGAVEVSTRTLLMKCGRSELRRRALDTVDND